MRGQAVNKVFNDPRLPQVRFDAQYLYTLNARLYELFREISNTHNAMADGFLFESTVATGNYTANTADQLILVNNTANCTITLPVASDTNGKRFVVKKVSNNPYTVTVTSSSTIDNETSQIIDTPYTSLDFVSDGTEYWII